MKPRSNIRSRLGFARRNLIGPNQAAIETVSFDPSKTSLVGFPFQSPADQDPRSFDLLALGAGSIKLEVMTYAKGMPGLRPLLILNSIEFPMPPSVAFCELMKQHGLQVVFIRRPGFGGTPSLPLSLLSEANIKNGAASVTEASIIFQAISTLDLKDVIVLGVGSANPVCYRLCLMHPAISLSVFSNVVFNQGSWEGFRPVWFQSVLKQTVLTPGGFRIASRGLKFYLKRNPVRFFDQILVKSQGDQRYRKENEADFLSASHLMRNIEPETFFYDLSMSLWPDPFLRDGLFQGAAAVVMSGAESTPQWLERSDQEARRLSIPIVRAPRGGLLTAYVAPEHLLNIIHDYSAQSAASTD